MATEDQQRLSEAVEEIKQNGVVWNEYITNGESWIKEITPTAKLVVRVMHHSGTTTKDVCADQYHQKMTYAVEVLARYYNGTDWRTWTTEVLKSWSVAGMKNYGQEGRENRDAAEKKATAYLDKLMSGKGKVR